MVLTGTWISARLPNWRGNTSPAAGDRADRAVAKTNDGVYSPELHDAYLRAVQPDSTDREIASNVRSATSRLGFVAGFEGAGVRASEDGTYVVDADAFTQFSQRTGQRTDVRVIAEHSLVEQIEAHAVTGWIARRSASGRMHGRLTIQPCRKRCSNGANGWFKTDMRSVPVTKRISSCSPMRWTTWPPKNAPMWRNGSLQVWPAGQRTASRRNGLRRIPRHRTPARRQAGRGRVGRERVRLAHPQRPRRGRWQRSYLASHVIAGCDR